VVVSFVLAGKDSTTSALTWFFWLLAVNPRCERRVHDEVSRSPDGDVKGMRYLHAALTEAMRMYPPVPFNGRVAVADDVLPDGTKVRAGGMVTYVPYSMGRMEYNWGPDAASFKPERWIGDDGGFRNASPFKFTAFQAGPRICLGKDSAYLQMKMALAILCRFFRFELVEGHPVKYRMMTILSMAHGLKVRVSRAPLA
jgi:cytochrome P450